MKPLTKTVVSRGGGIAARFVPKGGDVPGTPAQPQIPRHEKPPVVSAKPAAGASHGPRSTKRPSALSGSSAEAEASGHESVVNAKPAAGGNPTVANKPRYERWRDKNPELYKARQAEYMRKKRAADKAKEAGR